MTDTYKGYAIEFRESSETWCAIIGNSTYSNPSLAKVKKHIDNLDKKEFKRVDVYVGGWGYQDYAYQQGTVTSIDDEGKVWIVKKNGDRSKVNADQIFELSSENKTRVEKMAGLSQTQLSITNKIREISKSMTRWEVPHDTRS